MILMGVKKSMSGEYKHCYSSMEEWLPSLLNNSDNLFEEKLKEQVESRSKDGEESCKPVLMASLYVRFY